MALDMSRYTKLAKVERKLPIIFMINEKMLDGDKWEGGTFQIAIRDIMDNLAHRSVDAVISVVSFGEEVHLWSVFKKYDEYTDKEWPETKRSGKSVFNIGLMLVKDMLEDIDTTPEGNYDPIVVLFSSDEVSPGYKNELKDLKKDGRFKNVQRIGIADLSYDGNRYNDSRDSCNFMMERHTPKVLKEFAGENVALFVSDANRDAWWTSSDYGRTETKSYYTWFCPVLSMMELRYTEEEQQIVSGL